MQNYKILGINVWDISFLETLQKVSDFSKSKESHFIVTVNPEIILASRKDKKYREILNKSDLNVPDGVGLSYASWYLYGKKLKERVTGSDLIWEISKMASERGFSIYLLGAGPGIAKIASQRLKKLYPSLKIARVSEGEPRFTKDEVIENIKYSGADILFVAYGSPKQEMFISENLQKLGVKVAIGVGASIDFIAEKQVRAPRFMQKIGLEWLWRFFKEPKRVRRIFNAVFVFSWLVFWSKIIK